MEESFAALRALLCAPPEDAWRELFTFFDALEPNEEFNALAFPYIAQHVNAWPDSLRACWGYATEHPCWHLVRRLKLYDSTQEEIEQLGTHPHIQGLQCLGSDGRRGRVREWPKDALQHLTSISVAWGCASGSPKDFCHLPQLRKLQFTHEIMRGTRRAFDGWDAFPQLEELTLAPVELAKISILSPLSQLKALHLHDVELLQDLDGIQAHLKLQTLSITRCASLQSLHGCEALTELQSLDLWGCEELTKIGAIVELPKLSHLDLRYCPALPVQPTQPLMKTRQEVTAYQVRLGATNESQSTHQQAKGAGRCSELTEIFGPNAEDYLRGKYTSWAKNLTPVTMEALINILFYMGPLLQDVETTWKTRLTSPKGSLRRMAGVARCFFGKVLMAVVAQQIQGSKHWPQWLNERYSPDRQAFTETFQAQLMARKETSWAARVSERSAMMMLWGMGECLIRNGARDSTMLPNVLSKSQLPLLHECLWALNLIYYNRKPRSEDLHGHFQRVPSFFQGGNSRRDSVYMKNLLEDLGQIAHT